MRRLTLTGWVTLGVILAATAFVFLNLEPQLLFRNTTPSGGDMGAHVWGPAYLRDHLLPHGRITGWAPDWYAGFPYLVFYFPLPSLAIVVLSTVLPYGIAFKLVSVSGLLTLPAAAWAMGRLSGMRDPIPACLGVAMVPFLFDRTFTIYGGNIASTLAGEFAMSISLSVALVFLGVYARALQTGKHRALSAGLLAVCALCHVVPAFFAIGGAVVLTLIRFRLKALLHMWWTFAVSGLIAAFWVVPFLMRIAYTNDMGWEKITAYRATLIHPDERWVLLLALFGAVLSLILHWRTGLFLVLLAAGSALAFIAAPQGRLWNARLLPFWILSAHLLAGVAVADIGRLAVRALATLFGPEPALARSDVGELDAEAISADADDATDADPATLATDPVTAADEGWPPIPDPTDPTDPTETTEPERAEPAHDWAALFVPAVALIAALWFVATPLHILPAPLQVSTQDRSFIPDWVRWNYTGYEGKAAYPEYKDLVDTMASIGEERGCGRAMWEYESELDRLGTPMALMLLPHWTDGCIGSMEGLFFESSATTPYHFLNQAELSYKPSSAQRDLPYRSLQTDVESRTRVLTQGINHLKLLGVRYYMTISPEVQEVARTHPDLELITTSGPWQVSYTRSDLSGTYDRTWEIYQVADSELVEPLTAKPAVMEGVAKGGHDWLDAAVDWYQDESRWDVPLAASGPKDWPRVQGADPNPTREVVDPVEVTNIETDDDSIEFDVSEPGTPVLVKTSYFPNWQAKGADGPWRVTPNLMVVVPTSEHVELRYGHTPVDAFSWGLTILGLVGLVWLARRPALRFEKEPSH